jgi:hypothetical protein
MTIYEGQRMLGAVDPYIEDTRGEVQVRNENTPIVGTSDVVGIGSPLLWCDSRFSQTRVRWWMRSIGVRDPRVDDI